MQISCRCKHCTQLSINENDLDLCLEIDAIEGEIRFICRKCKKENILKIANKKEHEALPKIGITRY